MSVITVFSSIYVDGISCAAMSAENIQVADETIDPETIGEDTSEETISEPPETDPTEEDVLETVEFDLSEEVLSFGGFPKNNGSRHSDDLFLSSDEEENILDYLEEAFDRNDSHIDISQYGYQVDEVKDTLVTFLNEYDYTFTVDALTLEGSKLLDNAEYISVTYTDNSAEQRKVFDLAVTEILAGIDDSWSDYAKLLYLHDKLCATNEYDYTYSNYSAYNALVDHTSICQGYASAYQILANRAGIETDCVTGVTYAGPHAWNRSYISGKAYYTDCTWDDNSKEEYQDYNICGHSHFMNSFEHTYARHQVAYQEWYDAWCTLPSDEAYEFISNNEKMDYFAGDYLIYHDWNTYALYKLNLKSFAKTRIMDIPGTFVGLVSDGNVCFYSDQSHIYSMNIDGTGIKTIYTMPEENHPDWIYFLRLDGSILKYYVVNVLTGDHEEELDVHSESFNYASAITLSTHEVEFTRIGDQKQLEVSVSPASAIISWKSSNPSAVTVSNGKLTCVGEGTATITASSGNLSVFCHAYLDTTVQENYEYRIVGLESPSLVITKTKTEIDSRVIPGLIVEDGIEYTPCIEISYDSNIKKVTFEKGVYVSFGISFVKCSNLEYIDFSGTKSSSYLYGISKESFNSICANNPKLAYVSFAGADLNPITNVQWAFTNCPKLKEIDLSGLRFDQLDSAEAPYVTQSRMFYGSSNIETIHTPATVNPSLSVPIPEMYEYKDGAFGNKAYTDLMKAPVNSVLSKKLSLNDAQLAIALPSYEYTGSEIQPKVTVKRGETFLVPEEDYTVTYKDNVSIGTATATIIGTGRYFGTKSLTFKITKPGIETAQIHLSAYEYIYNGSAFTPQVKVIKDNKELIAGTDYSVSYSNNIRVGTAGVTIKGLGNYTGTQTAVFTITGFDVKNATVELAAYEYDYDGKAKTPAVTVKNGENSLKAKTDYTATYCDNIVPGKAAVVITGTGNCHGSKTVYFTINKRGYELQAESKLPGIVVGGTTEIIVNGAKGEVTYLSLDPDIAAVDSHGSITGRSVGSADITVISSETDTYREARTNLQIKVVEASKAVIPVPDVTEKEVPSGTGIILTSETPGADIYYTLDGSTPTVNSQLYSNPIVVEQPGLTIKAFSHKSPFRDSDIVTYRYTCEASWGDVTDPELQELFNKDVSKLPSGVWYAFRDENDNYTRAMAYSDYDSREVYFASYDAAAVTFSGCISVFHGKRKLSENTDYTVKYANNTAAADTSSKKVPSVTISGKGNYRDKATFFFAIEKRDISGTVLSSEPEVAVNAGARLGSVKPVLSHGSKKMTPGRDYTLEYYEGSSSTGKLLSGSSVAESGKDYFVKVLGIGNYTGELEDIVTIKVPDPKDKNAVKASSLKVSIPKIDYTGSPTDIEKLFDNNSPDNEPSAKVKYGKTELKYNQDYTVDYDKSTDHTCSGKHAFIIRGKDNGGSKLALVGTKKVTYEIAAVPMSKVRIAGLSTTVEYQGKAFELSDLYREDKAITDNGFEKKVTLYIATTENGKKVNRALSDDEYSYTMENTGCIGSFSLIFTGTGKYSGVLKKTIKVKGYNLKNDTKGELDISFSEGTSQYSYSKAGVRPKVTVKFAGKVLLEGSDYKLSFRNNNKVAQADDVVASRKPTVVVTGIGNFTGANASLTFSIGKADITENVSLIPEDKVYKSNAGARYFKSVPKFYDNGYQISAGKGKDIEAVSKDCCSYYYADTKAAISDKTIVPAGTVIEVHVRVTCSEKSSYIPGTYDLVGFYRMTAAGNNIKNAKVKIIKAIPFSFTNGIAIMPQKKDIVLTLGKTTLTEADYDIVSVTNNSFPGIATVTIRGKGEYGGTKTLTFKIAGRSLK